MQFIRDRVFDAQEPRSRPGGPHNLVKNHALALYFHTVSQLLQESRLNVPPARPARQGPSTRPGLPPETSHNLLGTPAPAPDFLEEWRCRLGLPRTFTLLPSSSSLLSLLPPPSSLPPLLRPPSSSSLPSPFSHIPPPSCLLPPVLLPPPSSLLFFSPLSFLVPPPTSLLPPSPPSLSFSLPRSRFLSLSLSVSLSLSL